MYGFNTIQEARKAVGINQMDAAKILGVSRSTIQNWEKGIIELNDTQKEIYIKILIESRRSGTLVIRNETIDLEFIEKKGISRRSFSKGEFSYAGYLIKHLQDDGYKINIDISD